MKDIPTEETIPAALKQVAAAASSAPALVKVEEIKAPVSKEPEQATPAPTTAQVPSPIDT
jgi:hypothetical protein